MVPSFRQAYEEEDLQLAEVEVTLVPGQVPIKQALRRRSFAKVDSLPTDAAKVGKETHSDNVNLFAIQGVCMDVARALIVVSVMQGGLASCVIKIITNVPFVHVNTDV